MSNRLLQFKLAFIIILFPLGLWAQPQVIEISDHHTFIDLIKKVETFSEKNHLSSFQEIIQEKRFTKNSKNIYLEYYNDENLWLKFSIRNSCTKERRFILEIPNATIHQLTLYKQDTLSEYKAITTGASHNFDSRDIDTRHFTFDVDIPPGEMRNYFIHVDSERDAVNFPLYLWKTVPYINKAVNERYFLGLYYGSILFIIIFHLFLYYKIKDKALIFYLVYVAGFAGYQLYMDGLASKYILPQYPMIAIRSVTIFAYLCFWSMIIFTQLYLNTAKIIPGFNKLLNIFKWILLIGMLMCLINYEIFLVMQHSVNFLGPLSTLMVIIGAFICSRHEPTLSKYLIVAFSFLIGGIMLEVTKNTGVVYNSDYALKLGHASEAIILAFALAVRFKLNDEYTQSLALERLLNLNQLKDQYNAELEQTVSLRTAELNISNKNLNDSILYARHIQFSLLPSEDLLTEYIPENFIYYKAKDIISGDFYWFEKVENKLIIAVVDCTGHGVPGAFMSMLGSTILRQIVKINKITYPGEILEILDYEIRSSLNQSCEDPYNKDGMDISIICYNMKDFTLEFAGAKRPVYHFSHTKSLTVYKGSKYSIGGDILDMAEHKEFCSQSIPLKKGDSIYLFTDGIIDQFGGEHNKKFMANKFKEELLSIQDLPMSVQGKKIEARIESWRGNFEQVDDILVMGLRF